MDIRGVVVDLDGTVYHGDEVIDGAPEAVAALRDHGLDLLFVTNNPTRTRQAIVEKLRGLGIEAEVEEVLSAGTVTARALASRHDGDPVFVIGSDGFRAQLREAGVTLTTDHGKARVVVTSHDRQFDYEDLTRALWALEDIDAFYGTDPDLVYPGRDGRPYPGSGAITRAVAAVADRAPDREFGKPDGQLMETTIEVLGHPAETLLVVGDGLNTDVAMGAHAGATTAFVLSGRGTRSDLETTDITPDAVVEDLSGVVDLVDT